MKSQFFKIAGVKSEKEFYAKYPTEQAFFKAHPEAKHLKAMARGGSAGGNAKQKQIMQLIQAYAQASGVDPRQIMQKLQQMPPDQQQQAIQQMAQAMQQQPQQMQMSQQPTMQFGGGLNHYNVGGDYMPFPGTYQTGGGIGQLAPLPTVSTMGPQNQQMNSGLSNYSIPNPNGGLAATINQAGMIGLPNYGIGQLAPLPVPVSNTVGTAATNTPKALPKKSGLDWKNSVVDLLDSIGWHSDMASRKILANQLRIKDYSGTVDQNKKMIKTILDNPQQFGSPTKRHAGYEGKDVEDYIAHPDPEITPKFDVNGPPPNPAYDAYRQAHPEGDMVDPNSTNSFDYIDEYGTIHNPEYDKKSFLKKTQDALDAGVYTQTKTKNPLTGALNFTLGKGLMEPATHVAISAAKIASLEGEPRDYVNVLLAALPQLGKVAKSLPAFSRLVGEKAIGAMNQTVGNPALEGPNLETFFSESNRFMPSVRKILAQAKYDANKLARIMAQDKEAAAAIEEAAQEELAISQRNAQSIANDKLTQAALQDAAQEQAALQQHLGKKIAQQSNQLQYEAPNVATPWGYNSNYAPGQMFRTTHYAVGGYVGSDGKRHQSTGANWSGNAFYADGGSATLEYPHMFKYPPTYEMGPHMMMGGFMQMGGDPNAQMQQAPLQQQQDQGQAAGAQIQQVMQEVAQKLQQSEQPQQILQELVQEGIPQAQAQQILQQVMQQMQGQQGAPQAMYGMGMKYGGIHINPANKGKFNATKKATVKTTAELTHSKNPLTRKRAIFAQNAAKWKHADGGPVIGQEMEVTPAQAAMLRQQGYKFDHI